MIYIFLSFIAFNIPLCGYYLKEIFFYYNDVKIIQDVQQQIPIQIHLTIKIISYVLKIL